MVLRIAWCLLLVSSSCWASNDLEVQYAYWRSDAGVTLSQARFQPSENWQVVDQLASYGFDKGEYWIRLNIHNPNQQSLSRVFRFLHPALDEVDIYHFVNNVLKGEWHLGEAVANLKRAVQGKNAAFKLNMPAEQHSVVFIRVAGINAMLLTMEVLSEEQHDSFLQRIILISGFVYGMLLVMALYNLSLAISIGDKVYFYYVFYVLSFIAFVLSVSGDGFYFLWGMYPEFNSFSLPFFSGLLMIPSLLFPDCLLDIKQYAPRASAALKAAVIAACFYLLCIPFMGIADSLIVINVFSAVASCLMLLLGVYLTYKNVPLAAIYTLAWCILLLGLVLLPLSSLGIIESNAFTRDANVFGGVAECIILSLVLAYRFRAERGGKINAIQLSLTAKSEAAKNRKMFEELFELAPVGIFRFKMNGELVAVNPALTKLLGFKDPITAIKQGLNIRGYFDNGLSMAKEVIKKGHLIDKETTLTTAKGELRTCSVSMRVQKHDNECFVEGYITDISERRHAQHIHELMERERMVVLEQLVTGVAHEINTPLGNNLVSLSHVTDLLKTVDIGMQSGEITKSEFHDFIKEGNEVMGIMSKNLNKISNLVERFKLVSVKNMEIDMADISIHQHLKSIIDNSLFLEEGVEVLLEVNGVAELHSYPAVWHIILDQLIENSMLHGFDTDQPDRKIIITLQQNSDNNWKFYYEDNGCGLAKEIKNKVFDPFVTTRRGNDNNAGLGMYRIYNLVRQVLKGDVEILEGEGFKLQIRFHVNNK